MEKENFNKKKIISKIYKNLGFSKNYSSKILDDFFEIFTSELIKSESVKSSEGVQFYSFGNGAERLFKNKHPFKQDTNHIHHLLTNRFGYKIAIILIIISITTPFILQNFISAHVTKSSRIDLQMINPSIESSDFLFLYEKNFESNFRKFFGKQTK